MSQRDMEEYRQRLLDLSRRIDGDLDGVREEALRGVGGDASGNLSNAPMHLADLGTDTFEQEVSAELLVNEQQVMLAIREALDRIEAGTFGRCADCNQEIPVGRLNALPYAIRCTACEEQAEREGDRA